MSKLKIVIADNESIIRMDLKEMLEEAGHEVVGECFNGLKAIELTQRLKPDLVIMDIKMPEMDGITAAKRISDQKLAPVILLTAFSQKDIVEKAKNSGVLAYLVKPIKPSNLFPAIEIALSRFNEIKQLESELDDIKNSLEMRKLLDRAKGILMDAYNLPVVFNYHTVVMSAHRLPFGAVRLGDFGKIGLEALRELRLFARHFRVDCLDAKDPGRVITSFAGGTLVIAHVDELAALLVPCERSR